TGAVSARVLLPSRLVHCRAPERWFALRGRSSGPLAMAAPGFPSPLWGEVRGGGNLDFRGLGIPPTLSLPHKGGGDAVASSSSLLGGTFFFGGHLVNVQRNGLPNSRNASICGRLRRGLAETEERRPDLDRESRVPWPSGVGGASRLLS